MSRPTFIDCDRIDLTPLSEADAEAVHRAYNHPQVRRYVDVFDAPRRLGAVREELSEESDDGGVRLAVRPRDGEFADETVGQVALDYVEESAGWANLSFWLLPAAQGRGYATEAAAYLVEFAFERRGLHRVSASAHAPNRASRAVLERLGFAREGTRREAAVAEGRRVDRALYGLLREEWDGPGAVIDG